MASLAVKYRPTIWDDVVGQEAVVTILKKQLQRKQFKNTYIFSGATGSGKTTTARIFANEINKGVGSILELDGASNNGVENVKSIVKSSHERSVNSEYKVYIIDEAHMLTTQAWNAFLKTVEEPPKYTIFIFCTTDVHKVPDTIKNRCMRFNFTRIPSSIIFDRLKVIGEKENITVENDVYSYISRISNGEMRNAISKLETCMDYSENITLESALQALGTFSYELYFKVINSVIDTEFNQVSKYLDDVYSTGADLNIFVNEFIDFILDILKFNISRDIESTKLPSSMLSEVERAINFQDSQKYYNYYIDKLLDLKTMLKTDSNPKQTIDIVFNKMCRLV